MPPLVSGAIASLFDRTEESAYLLIGAFERLDESLFADKRFKPQLDHSLARLLESLRDRKRRATYDYAELVLSRLSSHKAAADAVESIRGYRDGERGRLASGPSDK